MEKTLFNDWKHSTQLVFILLTISIVALLLHFECRIGHARIIIGPLTNESYTAGSDMPDAYPPNPYRTEYNAPGKADHDETGKIQNTHPYPGGGKYVELTMFSGAYGSQGAYFVELKPPSRVILSEGKTYYIAGMFRFERMNGKDIWNDNGDIRGSFDKLFEMQGDNFRWGIASGWDDQYWQYCARATKPCDHKFTFGVWVGKNSGVSLWPKYDHLSQNVSPYTGSSPYMCEYNTWYSVVLGVTAHNSPNGRVMLWINGTKVLEHSGATMNSATESTINRLYLNGTIAQPVYDSPQHKRQFDSLILTDDLQDIVNLNYLNFGPPNAPTGLIIRK